MARPSFSRHLLLPQVFLLMAALLHNVLSSSSHLRRSQRVDYSLYASKSFNELLQNCSSSTKRNYYNSTSPQAGDKLAAAAQQVSYDLSRTCKLLEKLPDLCNNTMNYLYNLTNGASRVLTAVSERVSELLLWMRSLEISKSQERCGLKNIHNQGNTALLNEILGDLTRMKKLVNSFQTVSIVPNGRPLLPTNVTAAAPPCRDLEDAGRSDGSHKKKPSERELHRSLVVDADRIARIHLRFLLKRLLELLMDEQKNRQSRA